jgi:S1-C subfamily serine protease
MARAPVFFLALFIAFAARAQIPGVPTLAPVLEKVTPAVVNIAVLQKSPEDENPMLRDPFFRRFFGGPGESEPQIAAGSGVIVDARNGYVVTNAHVVAGATDTTVTTQGGVELDATPVYYSPSDDLALLRVQGVRLPTLPVSSQRSEGEEAAVLGYPENGPYAVEPARIGETRATISEDSYGNGPVSRTITALRGSVRSGNSGGPLVDPEGDVVGIVFAATTGGGPKGGFAIPAEQVGEALANVRGEVETGPCTR